MDDICLRRDANQFVAATAQAWMGKRPQPRDHRMMLEYEVPQLVVGDFGSDHMEVLSDLHSEIDLLLLDVTMPRRAWISTH